ncbi:MAG: hypothetical protein ACXWG0_03310 [Chthoniobacterales bacterium]
MISKIRKVSLYAALALLLGTALAGQVRASMVSFTPTPVDLNDLDHHMVYTWRIDNINLNGGTISGASLTFTNIANWDGNANVLHLWLLDTAKNAGVGSFVDDPTNSSPVTDMTDDFLSTRFHANSGWLVANGTAQTFLADKSFTTTPGTYTLNFTPAELTALQQYITSGKDIAFGIDPDCHFFNDGVTFSMNVTPVPEINALFPLVGLLAAVSSTHFLRRRRMARVPVRS